MRLRHLFILVAAMATMAFAQQQRVLLRADMSGLGKGKIVWKAQAANIGTQVEIQAEGENLRPFTTYKLTTARGLIVRFVRTDGIGTYHYAQRRTGLGNPVIRVGDRAVLTDAAGRVVQSGTFRL